MFPGSRGKWPWRLKLERGKTQYTSMPQRNFYLRVGGATFPDCFQYPISSGLPQWAWTQLCHILGCACISPERVPTSIPWNSVKDCLKEQGPCLRQDAVSSRQTEAYTELICYGNDWNQRWGQENMSQKTRIIWHSLRIAAFLSFLKSDPQLNLLSFGL